MRTLLPAVFFLAACAPPAPPTPWTPVPSKTGDRIAAHAVDQSKWGTNYDASYKRLAYPGGDVARDRGACTDVVIRALRSVGYDLQKLVHEDAKKNRRRYPRIDRLDTNIDHRRCPNLVAYFKTHGKELDKEAAWRDWQPGDVVFWKLLGGLDHVGVVTGVRNSDGKPWVVHNIAGTAHEDALTNWKIVGRYRFPR